MIKVFLKKGKEVSLQRRHPWIFSGAIDKVEGQPENGDTVSVFTHDKQFKAWGHYQAGSIMVRILSFEAPPQDGSFWKNAIQTALNLRLELNIIKHSNIFRLVHGEGDHLPGLVLDIFGNTAVIQCHSIGMFRNIEKIKEAVMALDGWKIDNVFDKSAESLGKKGTNGFLHGALKEAEYHEYGHLFHVDFIKGQKTGFFIDQRENRRLLGKYAVNKSVLNTFCYSGGFSVYALKAGAQKVVSVDASVAAIELTSKNVALNGFDESKHSAVVADVMEWLRPNEETFDIIVVDPPAFAKHMNAKHNAVQAYKRLNAAAIRKVNEQGLLFTFSCSQVIDPLLFRNTILAAAIEAGRKVQIIHQLSQGPDHPINIFHPEGEYLKGLVLKIS